MSEKIYSIAVIGGGSAGVMALTRAVLNNDETLFFPGTPKDRKRSRERWVKKVENMPAHLKYERGIEGPNKESLDWLEQCELKHNFIWKKNTGVTALSKEGELFIIKDSNGEEYKSRFVILCTGVMDIQPKVNDSIRDILPYANKQTADYCLRCDGHHVYQKEVSIIGHTNVAAWTGFILKERYNVPNMAIITNGEKTDFSEESQKLIELYNIDVYLEPIHQVLGDPKTGKLEAFILCCGTTVPTEMCFISLGMLVYNELAKGLGADLDERGFVKTNDKGESSVPGLFVAGDLRANTKKQIYTAWDTAVDSADNINSILRREKRERLLSGQV